MKRLIPALMLLGIAASSYAADVNMSLSIGQPGFYGRIDIGDYPRPRLIFAEPIIVHRVAVAPAPIYLHVPPGHAKDWKKHCARYDACGRPVYFIEESWYNDVYVPKYQERHGKGGPHGKGPKEKGHGKNK